MIRLATLGVLFAAGCGGHALPIDRAATYYLQYNMRADGTAAVSINYWAHSTILPMCTPVQVERAGGRRVTFTANGQRYTYTLHRTSTANLTVHFNRTFGAGCPDVASFSPVDQQGIRMAQPLVGMSKAGVIAAVGYPPEHRTATLEQPLWTYWGVEGGVTVTFAGDAVQTIQGNPQEPAVVAGLQGGAPAAVAGAPVASTTTTAGGVQIQEHDGSQTVEVPDEATIVVTDANGYPVRVPQSAVGKICGPQQPCHQALVCTEGLCQAP